MHAYEADGTAGVISVLNGADRASIAALETRIDELLAAGYGRIVIDLLGLQHPDTKTLSALCAALRRAARNAQDAGLAVVSPHPRLRWVLEQCQIDRLELHHNINAALALAPQRSEPLRRTALRQAPDPPRPTP